ncbi:MAG: hypothetical protein NMNS01_29850 [Nitrosomonas sp.]|nr:MAG: hypothetical protein NMNS01_29850 [Nitrosomonas sp.]
MLQNKNNLQKTILIALCISISLFSSLGWSHGWVGKRFFPSTLATEDPYVNDELSFIMGRIRGPSEDGALNHATNLKVGYAKTIFPRFALSLGGNVNFVNPVNQDSNISGFSNMEIGAKYQFLTSEKYESLASIGLEASIGGTGKPGVPEANSFSILMPGIFFGQGFGFFPETMKYLRPLALTGVLQANVPLSRHSIEDGERHRNPNSLSWGATLQYSIPYLQAFVKDVGIPTPFNRIIPVVEVSANSCIDPACMHTTGSINPGVIWLGRKFQLGIEATVPFNDTTGRDVGMLVQFHVFVDDLFPKTIGRPLFR